MTFIDSDFQPCHCGHDGAFHAKQYTNVGGHTNIFIGYLHCEWTDHHYGADHYSSGPREEGYCTCQQFRIDNLRMLERLSED